MNYGMLYYVSLVAIGGAVITWALVWSRREKERKECARFAQLLAGYKFTSWNQLQCYWKARGVQFNLDGPFDESRHGNLLDTLKTIDDAACEQFGDWIS